MDKTPLRHRLGLDKSIASGDEPIRHRPSTNHPTSPPAGEPPQHIVPSWQPQANDDPDFVPVISVRHVVKEMLETAIFILLIFFIVRGIVQNFKIEGSSMQPSLESGQYILVNKLVYFHFDINAPMRLLPGGEDVPPRVVYPFHLPQRGDIIVFEFPKDPSRDYIKRVIGLPGETIEIRNDHVYVNGNMIDEPYLGGKPTSCNANACSQGPVEVPSDAVYVMGDNRSNSSDSREWETLPLDKIIGQAWVLYYPIGDDWGFIPHQAYAIDQ